MSDTDSRDDLVSTIEDQHDDIRQVVRRIINLAFPRQHVYRLLLLLVVLSIPAALFHDALLLFAQPAQAPAGGKRK